MIVGVDAGHGGSNTGGGGPTGSSEKCWRWRIVEVAKIAGAGRRQSDHDENH
ncbi:MAG: hypothetical protein IPL84_00395 [Chitinophagaceae bacterium]|nr:hypothetical protein [Chitinophagaceae bacterium]